MALRVGGNGSVSLENCEISANNGEEGSILLINNLNNPLKVNLKECVITNSKRNGIVIAGLNVTVEAVQSTFKDNKQSGVLIKGQCTEQFEVH